MSDTINTEQASGGAVSSATNSTTKAALLQRAKEAVKWRRSGYTEHSPFGPTTKKARVQHAKQRARASAARESKVTAGTDADDAQASAERRKAEYAEKEAETLPSTPTSPLEEFKAAVDHWFPKMDCDAKREAVSYAQSKV
jgi:hypothetical protein